MFHIGVDGRFFLDRLQSFHTQLAITVNSLQRSAVDIAHLISVITWILFAHVVVLHITYGAFLERVSTLREAQIFTMEMVVSGSFGNVMDFFEQSGYVVRATHTFI